MNSAFLLSALSAVSKKIIQLCGPCAFAVNIQEEENADGKIA
jgi:hypothetical protein